MKAAIYARTGSKDQSTVNQIDLCREYIHECGGTVIGIYDDEGMSAHNLDREGLNTMMRDAMEKKFDTIVVTGYDRLFRESEKLNEFLTRLSQLNIELHVVKTL